MVDQVVVAEQVGQALGGVDRPLVGQPTHLATVGTGGDRHPAHPGRNMLTRLRLAHARQAREGVGHFCDDRGGGWSDPGCHWLYAPFRTTWWPDRGGGDEMGGACGDTRGVVPLGGGGT